MSRQLRGYLVPPEGEMRDVVFEDHKDIQRIIGCRCFTSMPSLFDDEPACYVNDEGKLDMSAPNRAIYDDGSCVDITFGNMFFCGVDMATGEARSITDEEVRKVRRRFGGGKEGPGSGLKMLKRVRFELALRLSKRELVKHGKI